MTSSLKQIFRFLLVGGMATALQFLLLTLFVELELLDEVPASAAAYFLSAIANYLANYHLTFASKRPHRETLPRFAATAALGLGINTLVFALVFWLLHYYLLAQVIATGVTLVCNFLLHKFWIYRH
jgi:putative flippase GtrA